MKTIRQFTIFLLGTAAGLGLFALVMPLLRHESNPTPVAQNVPAQVVTASPQTQKATPRRRRRARVRKHSRAARTEMAAVGSRPRRHRGTRRVNSQGNTVLARYRQATPTPVPEAAPALAQTAPAPQVQPVPTVFRSIGYAERADGQLTAFILQEDHVQIVRIGDRISERYRVTNIRPDAVVALDEGAGQTAVAKLITPVKSEVLVAQAAEAESSVHRNTISEPGANEIVNSESIGYIDTSNVIIDATATGSSVRLVSSQRAEAPKPVKHREMSLSPRVVPEPKPTVTLASSAVSTPAVRSDMSSYGATFRQVVYEENSADDEAIPKAAAISAAREQNP